MGQVIGIHPTAERLLLLLALLWTRWIRSLSFGIRRLTDGHKLEPSLTQIPKRREVFVIRAQFLGRRLVFLLFSVVQPPRNPRARFTLTPTRDMSALEAYARCLLFSVAREGKSLEDNDMSPVADGSEERLLTLHSVSYVSRSSRRVLRS